MSDAFRKREQAFEAEYIARHDRELIEKIHRQRREAEDRAALARITGIEDESVLQEILDLGLGPHNLQILSIVPLVVVAWASGQIEPKQRHAILTAAREEGLCEESGSQELLDRWLEFPVSLKLVHAWREYLHSILEKLDADSGATVRRHWLERAERVARASGNILGVFKISSEERIALEQLEAQMTLEGR